MRLSYDVTGMSPQSRTVAHELNGLVSNGTLYPPLSKPRQFISAISAWDDELKVETARTLTDS